MLVILLTVTALALTVTTLATINVNQNFSSSGNITTTPNVGIYCDSTCTTNVTSLSWGSVAAGTNASQIVYVRNVGTGCLTLNNNSTSNWSPSNTNTYLTISWNQTNTQLLSGQSVPALITLTVASNTTGISTFSNTIIISGSG